MEISEQEDEAPVVPTHTSSFHSSLSGSPILPAVSYRECLKNHAAAFGGSATDGCGEFMPGGADRTLEALKCSACGCHRNFHRKEVEGEPSSTALDHRLPFHGVVMPRPVAVAPPLPTMGPLFGIRAAAGMKKRRRTTFTPEQKERMLDFAEKVGWRLQRQEDAAVQRFCDEIGVKRRVFKAWAWGLRLKILELGCCICTRISNAMA
ncbi:hypothetical protein HPP92_001824 [Vanilla planifolia]|uniref:ZF-HD dimerization-type domain-containing protein n=1 Tax=Vanilla planifolia TaxID=51239 RepID=A0A835SDK6_VANPL|nr:hypothetical protein HPP92_001824 [Vanilla planifolia]